MRSLLGAAEVPYSWAVRWRNLRYDSGHAPTHQVDVPVVSVGNLTLGGTGKTPLVSWLAQWFHRRDVRVSIVSRGYGSNDGSLNDEARELAEKLPDIPHIQNPDRWKAARQAIAEYDAQLILLDDAFQHRRIARDLDLVVVDALEPFGFGHVFPRGLLREPECGLSRADVVVLSRANTVAAQRRVELLRQVDALAPNRVWVESSHVPQELLSADGKITKLDQLANRPVAAFCGIGNPGGFRHTLADAQFKVVAFRTFSDHHDYTRSDIQSLTGWIEQMSPLAAVICTHKDLVKLNGTEIAGCPLKALVIGVRMETGQHHLEEKLVSLLNQVRRD